jgi:predicted MFS family arabinose efflux permease
VALCGVGIASLVELTASRAHLYGLFAVMGVAGIGTSALAYSRAISTWFDARRGLALSTVISGGAVASISHPPAIEALVGAVGWRTACLLLGLLILAVGVPTVATFVRERATTRSGVPSETVGAPASVALRSSIIWILLVAIGTATVATNAVTVHLPSLLTDRGMIPQRAALGLSVMGVASVIGRLLTGWLVDRFRGTYVSFVMLLIAAIGIALLAHSHVFGTNFVAIVLIGFGLGGELDITPFLLSRYFGLRAVSTLYGLGPGRRWALRARSGRS